MGETIDIKMMDFSDNLDMVKIAINSCINNSCPRSSY